MLATEACPTTRHEYARILFGAPNYQLIEGDLVIAPSPSSFHQDFVGNRSRLLGNFTAEHSLGKIHVAPLDVYLSDLNVFRPDVFFICKENLAIIEARGIEGAPDLAIEILSKTTGECDAGPRHAVYANTGVEELWVIDPAKRTLALYRLAENSHTPVATYRAKQKFTSTLLPGLTIELAAVFAS